MNLNAHFNLLEPHTDSKNSQNIFSSFLLTIRFYKNQFRQIWRPFEKWPFSGRSKLTKTVKTRFTSPRSHIDSENYEFWNLAITWHPGSNKVVTSIIEIVCKISIFKGYIFRSDYSEFSTGHNFFSHYEISIFQIHWKDILK